MVRILFSPVVELDAVSSGLSIIEDLVKTVYKISPKPNLVERLLIQKHMSLFEFIQTIWYVECSRVCSHEIVRHRIASYFQESQRYVKTEPIFLIPRSLIKELGEEKLKKFLQQSYEVYDSLTFGSKRFGEDFKQFARYILPQCVLTRLKICYNLRELFESFLPLRMCRRALPEIRYIAVKMYLKLRYIFPELMNYVGARCIWYRYCPELNLDNPEIMRKCRIEGYKEAFQEHGTDEEIERIDEIVQKLP